jgi:hypothetical protein
VSDRADLDAFIDRQTPRMFVTEAGLPDYLALIEKQVSAVRLIGLYPNHPKPESVKAAN